jgi:general nucleoside transport system permease protein
MSDSQTHSQRIIASILPVSSILMALVFGAGLIMITGVNPIKAYGALFAGAFSDLYSINTTVIKTIPLIFAGLGVSLALKAGFFNVGAEGQLYLGGAGATLAGLYFAGLPVGVHIALGLIAGFVFGGLWSAVPGFLKVKYQVNEIITCLFLNFIGVILVTFLTTGPLLERGAPAPMSAEIAQSAQLPVIIPNTDIHIGLVLSLVLALAMSILFSKTTLGYEIKFIGQNPKACHYAGIDLVKSMTLITLVSGGLAGLAGACEIMGLRHRLYANFSPGYGWDAIVVAFLAKNHPFGIVVASLFFGSLRSGAGMMQRLTGVPADVVFAIHGLVILFVAIGLALPEWRSSLKVGRKGHSPC